MRLDEQEVLSKVTKFLFPFIVTFGVYVVTHGEIGPGGGFQGGVIIAAAYILYALVFGLASARRMLPRKLNDVLCAVGVLIYAGVGVATLLLGGTFLEYDRLIPGNPAGAQALGMTLVEIGVGLTVATVMISLFGEMADRGRDRPEPDDPAPESTPGGRPR